MTNDPGPALFCACVLVPFLGGIGATLLVQSRTRKIGLPWALVPGGSVLKALWERRQ